MMQKLNQNCGLEPIKIGHVDMVSINCTLVAQCRWYKNCRLASHQNSNDLQSYIKS